MLRGLDLSHNAIAFAGSELPPPLPFPALTRLDLSHNALLTLPSSLSALAALRFLALRNNALSALPTRELQLCPSLCHLDAAANRLTGSRAHCNPPGLVCSCALRAISLLYVMVPSHLPSPCFLAMFPRMRGMFGMNC